VFELSEIYRPRAISFCRLEEWRGWRLKVYAVQYRAKPLQWDLYEEGLSLALPGLPQPAVTRQRPGVGFVVVHQGRGMHNLIVNWWDRENEFFNRVFIRPFGADGAWRIAEAGEVASVWDLQLISFEREEYVRQVLARPGGPDLEAYLAAQRAIPL